LLARRIFTALEPTALECIFPMLIEI